MNVLTNKNVKLHPVAENKAFPPQPLLGAAARFRLDFFRLLENLVADAGNAAALVVKLFDDLKFSFSDFRKLFRRRERDDAFPQIDCGGRPDALEGIRQIGAPATKERLSGICSHCASIQHA
jgi:hypothetical protein